MASTTVSPNAQIGEVSVDAKSPTGSATLAHCAGGGTGAVDDGVDDDFCGAGDGVAEVVDRVGEGSQRPTVSSVSAAWRS